MNRLTLAFAALTILAGCNQHKEEDVVPTKIAVSDAMIRLPAVEGRPGAAYFTIHGGPAPDRLVAVTSARVATIELHESKMENGMMSMAPLTGVDVSAGGEVVFKPGGNHAMLFGIDPAVKLGDALTLHFSFQSGAKVDAEAKAVAAGDAMPMEGMAH